LLGRKPINFEAPLDDASARLFARVSQNILMEKTSRQWWPVPDLDASRPSGDIG
jgi:hypothetical protein